MLFILATSGFRGNSHSLPRGRNPFWYGLVFLFWGLLTTVPAAFAQNLTWQKIYNGPHSLDDRGVKVKSDSAGNVYVAGTSESDIVLIKYNSAGVQQWAARYDSVFVNEEKALVHTEDQASDLVMDAQGNLYVTGTSYYEDACRKVMVVTLKYTPSGVREWKVDHTATASCGPASQMELPHAALDGSGQLYLAVSYRATSRQDNRIVLQKLTLAGGEVWKRSYPGTGGVVKAIALEVDAGGNAYIAGSETFGLLLKYDPAGVLQWQKPVSVEVLRGVSSDASGNAYVVGSAQRDFVTIKYDAAGVEQWQDVYNYGTYDYNGTDEYSGDQASQVLVDAAGNVYVTGTSYFATNCDYLVALVFKYNSRGGRQWATELARAGCVSTSGGVSAPLLAMDGAKNLYAAVTYQSLDGISIILKKLTPTGVEAGSSSYQGEAAARVNALHVDAAGNSYLTGSLTMYEVSTSTFVTDMLTLKYACPSLAFTPATGSALISATVGHAYRQAITTDPAGYSFTASGLPAGLSISAEGVISGTPTTVTSSRDSVSVTVTQGTCSATATYSLSVIKGQQVVSFTLVNAATGEDIQPLKEGDVLNLLVLPAQLSVRANTDPGEVGSVVFGLNDQPTLRTENFVPYALASNYPDDRYVPYPFQVGDYVLSATPYSQVNGQEEKGLILAIHFQVVRPRVASFTLINAATGGEVQPLQEGDVLDLATLPAQLSVRANTEPAEVGSVVFGLNDKPNIRVENFVPYALAGKQPDGRFLFQFGSEGSGEGQFNYPEDVAVDGSGHVYVSDRYNSRIQKFDSEGRFLLQFGSYGSGEGQFNWPTGVAVDGSGNLYVTEYSGNRVQKFDSLGGFLFQFGSQGSGEGQFSGPGDVAVDGSGNLYVADFGNNRVQKFDSSGRFLSQFGRPGGGDGQFNIPASVAVDCSGNVYVTDYGNARIQKLDSSGRFLAQFGSYGSSQGQFLYPAGVAVDRSGNVYVTDTGNYRIVKLDSSGRFLSQFGSYGSGEGQFNYPQGLAVDGSGNVYVTDYYNNRIQVFSSGSYLPYAFQVGEYALSATPYRQANGQGEKGLGRTVNFRVVNSASTARTSVGEGVVSLEVAAYPNPFGEKVFLVIRSSLSQSVELHCYDAKGVEVGKMYEGELQAGQAHRLEVDGRTWPDGLYFLRVSTPQEQLVRKVLLLRK